MPQEDLVKEIERLRRRVTELEDLRIRFEQTAEELRRSENKFRKAFDHAAFGMAMVGLDGRFFQVNQALCRMFGYPEGELMGLTFQALTHPQDLEEGLDLFQTMLHGRKDHGNLEKRYIHKDGSVVWAILSTYVVRDDNGRPLFLVSQIQDVTERREAEAALKESEEALRSIFEQSVDGILLTSPDGGILKANEAACRMLGRTEQEIREVGRDGVVDLTDPRLGPALEERMRTGRFRGELKWKKKDGTTFDAEISSGIFRTSRGDLRTTIIVRDITERKAIEKELRRTVKLLGSVYESLDEAVFVVDPQTRTITSCNSAAQEVFGYRMEEMIGRNTEFLHVNRKMYTEFGKRLFPALDKEGIFQTEFSMRKKDDTVFPTHNTVKEIRNESGRRIIVVSVVRDISAHQKAMNELKERETELRSKTLRLEELNTALKVLLEQRDLEKKTLEENFSESINNLIIPYLDEIRKSGLSDLQGQYLDVLEENLREIMKPYQHRIAAKLMHLSPSETRIVSYLKQGYRTKDIATKLSLSLRTVEFHRDNIRKKLGIKNRKVNLTTYLSGMP